MDWKCKIKKVKNGYVLTLPPQDEDDLKEEYIFEESPSGKTLDNVVDMLYFIVEYFAESNNRDGKRIKIDVVDKLDN